MSFSGLRAPPDPLAVAGGGVGLKEGKERRRERKAGRKGGMEGKGEGGSCVPTEVSKVGAC